MTDTFTKEVRSQIMQKVKSAGNRSTEMRLIKVFKEKGIKGWRRNYKVIGKPDFVFPKLKIAVFADGCFWHGHNCRNTNPQQNQQYWAKKQSRNQARDQYIVKRFAERGWKVLRFWECEIKKGLIDLTLLQDR